MRNLHSRPLRRMQNSKASELRFTHKVWRPLTLRQVNSLSCQLFGTYLFTLHPGRQVMPPRCPNLRQSETTRILASGAFPRAETGGAFFVFPNTRVFPRLSPNPYLLKRPDRWIRPLIRWGQDRFCDPF
jgi:hypothetical protein